MNTRVANVIALELGILIAILAWLAFSNLSNVKQYAVAQSQERTAGAFATVAPVSKSRSQSLYAADYRAGRQPGQLEDGEQAPAVQEYDQEIAAEPYASSDLADGGVTESSPYYSGVDQEPVVTSPDCLFSPFDQIVVYPQPNEIILFSNARSFGRRHQSPARFTGARMMVAHRRPGGGESHARGSGSVTRRNTGVRSLPQRQGFRPR